MQHDIKHLENLHFISAGFVIVAYLLGSFSSAITLSKLMRFPDPRSEGSNNPGATNVLRIAGKKAAALTLFGDLLKGFAPVLVAALLIQDSFIVALVGFSAFIGHCYPIYYGFEGGKGVATAIGFILAFDWLLGFSVVGIWLLIAKTTGYSALAALIAFSCMPFIVFALQGDWAVTGVMGLLTIILIYRHRSNIQNLLDGSEDKSSLKEDQ